MTNLHRRALAELFGTTILVFFGAGSAVFGADDPDRAIQSLRASASRHRH